jgi:hypothetical protein
MKRLKSLVQMNHGKTWSNLAITLNCTGEISEVNRDHVIQESSDQPDLLDEVWAALHLSKRVWLGHLITNRMQAK